ncbi:MAG: thiamine/thiamine pyrophosphate ABC transporter permease ThiP [Rubricella sp.]
MARQPVAVSAIFGWGATALTVALTLGTAVPLLAVAEGPGGLFGADWPVIRFTILQATLSALITVSVAIPLARALARRRFPGRDAVILALGAPFIVPTIVAVFGILAVWGRSGLFSDLLSAAGFARLDVYGLTGILLAHVFLNLPLVTRLLLQGWAAIPAEHHRLAFSLGFSARDRFAHIEWPMLREVVPGAALLTFLICLTSFAVALILGGGPRATTLELALYQALRFEFDLPGAAWLALVQAAIGLTGAFALLALGKGGLFSPGAARRIAIPAPRGGRMLDATAIVAALLFLALPLASVFLDGLAHVATLPRGVWEAAARSLAVAVPAAILSLLLALPIAWSVTTPGNRIGRLVAEGLVLTALTASSLVIGTGLFIVLRSVTDPFAMALPVTAVVNAALGVPFALRILVPAIGALRRGTERQARALGLPRRIWLSRVLLPGIRPALGFALGLVAAFSVGDLGIIALFGTTETATLPLEMQRLLGDYRIDDAAGAALLLLALSFTLFAVFDLWGRHDPLR